jgi:hypothetical protein
MVPMVRLIQLACGAVHVRWDQNIDIHLLQVPKLILRYNEQVGPVDV